MIGASVDNIRKCKCDIGCQNILMEYICHWEHRDLSAKEAFLTPEIGGNVIEETFTYPTIPRCRFKCLSVD